MGDRRKGKGGEGTNKGLKDRSKRRKGVGEKEKAQSWI